MDAISVKKTGFIVNDYTTDFEILNEISKTTINFFPFEWLDTSALSIIDFSDKLEFYQIEDTVQYSRKSGLGSGIYHVYWTQSRV